MKFFKNALVAVAVVAFGFAGTFAQTEKAVVTGIQTVTTASASLQVTVSTLNITNFPVKGVEIVSGLKSLTASITSFTKTITVSDPVAFDNSAAEEVVEVLVGFVEVHQALLNTIIGKQSLASRFFLTAPIAVALRALEAVVDTFALALISLIPTQKTEAQVQFAKLTVTFSQAIKVYS